MVKKINYVSLIFLNLQLCHASPEWSLLFWCNEEHLLIRKMMSGSIPDLQLFVKKTTVSTFWLSSELRLHREWPYRAATTRFLERLDPRKHFNVGSALLLGWYDVAASRNVKSMLKQHCISQRWNLQCSTTLIERYVELTYVRKRRNNVVIFNVDFHNAGQRRNKIHSFFIIL